MPRNLLLADDSTTIRKAVAIAFAGEDYVVDAASDGEEALEKARASRPDVLLVDTVMPGMSGYDLCKAIQDDLTLTGTPVLLLAGVSDPVDDARARACGAAGHVTKPFDCATLVGKVREIVEGIPAPSPAPSRPTAQPSAQTGAQTGAQAAASARVQPAPRRTVPPPLPPRGHPLWGPAAAPPDLPPPPPPLATSSAAAVAAPASVPAPAVVAAPAGDGGEAALRLALSQASREVVEKIAWEVIPQLAETIIREQVERLVNERQKS